MNTRISLIINDIDFSDVAIDNIIKTQSIDITSNFVWTDNLVIAAASGNTKSSSIMKACDYVDITNAIGMELSFMTWTSSSGGVTTYGLAFYDSEKNYISGKLFPIGNSGNSNGEKYMLCIDVPSEACYIRTTYVKDTNTYGEFKATIFNNI